jgi:hypothetical protein
MRAIRENVVEGGRVRSGSREGEEEGEGVGRHLLGGGRSTRRSEVAAAGLPW